MSKPFQVIEHTADLQLRVTGTSMAELFTNALIGMFSSMQPEVVGGCSRVSGMPCGPLPQQRKVIVHSHDTASLLIDFLSEALYLSAVHHEAYLGLTIKELSDKTITAVLHGVKVQGFACDIKAVTYHDVHLVNRAGEWSVDIVFDI